MLRVRPSWPVAQNGQFMPQPAWLEMQTVTRLRVAHDHRLDEGTVEEPPHLLDRGPAVGGEVAHRGEQGRQQVGDEVVAHGLREVGHVLRPVDEPLEVVRRQLGGAVGRVPQGDDGLPALREA